jgi:hypothetical protein
MGKSLQVLHSPEKYTSTCPFLPFIHDEMQFFKMRSKALGEPKKQQSQIALSAAIADIDNDQTDDQIMKEQTTKETTNSSDKFFVHYTHEQRFNTLKKDMHQVYDDVFQNTPAMCTKMRVCTRNRRDAKKELIRKRPKRTLLRNAITERKCHSQILSSEPYIIYYDYLLCVFTLQVKRIKYENEPTLTRPSVKDNIYQYNHQSQPTQYKPFISDFIILY